MVQDRTGQFRELACSFRLQWSSTQLSRLETCGCSRPLSDTVAGYRRRRLLVEEVPGLYIRRLTLEDPRSAARERDCPDSRSPSPARHICHPPSAHERPGRGSSSYRSWLERIRNERPAYLTITSLELPESPIPLIDSQASSRSRGSTESPRSNPDKDVILDEFLDKVSKVSRDKDKDHSASVRFCGIDDSTKRTNRRRGTRNRCIETARCNENLATLEECTKNIVEGPTRHAMRASSFQASEATFKDCICSEISENLRINIREKTEVRRSSRSPSPEVTHTIRIAMKYHGQSERKSDGSASANVDNDNDNDNADEKNGRDERRCGNKNTTVREDGCCPGVNVALDFTLNCSSVQLTSRDINLRTGASATTRNNNKDSAVEL